MSCIVTTNLFSFIEFELSTILLKIAADVYSSMVCFINMGNEAINFSANHLTASNRIVMDQRDENLNNAFMFLIHAIGLLARICLFECEIISINAIKKSRSSKFIQIQNKFHQLFHSPQTILFQH